jgi:uncharacterized RDD family membrane protein YckC
MVASERLTIDTPEQVALELPVAGVGSRFLALAVDTVIQALLYLVLVLGLGLIAGLALGRRGSLLRPLGQAWAPAVIGLLLFCVYWGYFAAFEIAWQGQTPGKRVAGIRVIKDSGRPADAASIVLRNLLRVVDVLPAMYAVGVLSMLVTRHARRIGDLVAGTLVVHDRPSDSVATLESMQPAARATTLPVTLRLSDEELALVETYLGRRLDLPPDVQDRTAARIASRLEERHGIAPVTGDFLDAVVRQTRDAARYR